MTFCCNICEEGWREDWEVSSSDNGSTQPDPTKTSENLVLKELGGNTKRRAKVPTYTERGIQIVPRFIIRRGEDVED